MKLVIDSNRFLAGLLKDSTSRKIINNKRLDFCSPDYLITEINKHRMYLAQKTKQTDEQLDVVFYSLLDRIDLIPYEDFKEELEAAIELLRDVDVKDAPFLAVGMAVGAVGIWTEDKHFHKQNILKVVQCKEI
ncbi:MAG: PIN domain-containing protein [Candidatus Thermoplasmatota archaeon]